MLANNSPHVITGHFQHYWNAAFVFLYFYVVETKNKTLEETAALFDGEEASNQLAAATEGVTGGEHRDAGSMEKANASEKEGSVVDVPVLDRS